MSVSEFKARCLAEFEAIARGGEPLLITKRGVPVAQVTPPVDVPRPRRELGRLAGTVRIHGDIVGPIVPAEEWESLR